MDISVQAITWLDQIFVSKGANGQVVRRNRDLVAREIGIDRFIAEVRARELHLLQTADQFVVICHRGEIRLLF